MEQNRDVSVRGSNLQKEYYARAITLQSDGTLDDIITEFGIQVDDFRKEIGMTAKTMSALMDVNQTSYFRYSNGERIFPLRSFLTFCLTFGYDITELSQLAYFRKTDAPLKDLAIMFGTLSDETLKSVNLAIQLSNEKASTKKRISRLIDKVCKAERPVYAAYDEFACQDHIKKYQESKNSDE